MVYVLAVLFPPAAIMVVGEPKKALLNLVLWLFFIIPAIIHAFFVIDDSREEEYLKKHEENLT
ncbi:YqaE/Pmp3 family membrane protein [Pontibacillus marinus]|uniref:Proteolipid membrane potential modulator n=1 Tax=Pontibacillus marinus BH030004 = DSM 16465 TaxID=1385511 RepID=A0A0A5GDE4_9BACI|nr:YqaE/Pmp3 family membrane protein [Pontibacillus marinus]KGX91241.1 Proteolipid membrane potential modulator [Pontibacillus marinus BH030004 = DSM 16465]